MLNAGGKRFVIGMKFRCTHTFNIVFLYGHYGHTLYILK